MNADQQADWLKRNIERRVRILKLNPAKIHVRHVLNWGGFVNHSFHVTDGASQYHLKLARQDESTRFDTWLELHEVLEARYRAPELIARVDFSDIGFSGLVFRHIDGTAANFRNDRALLTQLVSTADGLHRDAEIRAFLETRQAPGKTCLDYFVETYIHRFTADLAGIAMDPPWFVSPALLEWMLSQTQMLEKLASSMPAFHQAATEPVHGDLHEGNIIVGSDGWFIVDWDDLTLGDSALEFAILLWPLIYRTGARPDTLLTLPNGDFSARLDLCLRAQLLDEVIDTVADYVEAGTVPSDRSRVEEVKRVQHEEGLKRYVERFGESFEL